ncbi:MAG: 4-hydroxy-tetrahydrodipicolinate synthase [Phycisphaeraceae bacterium]|nr:4-hydroxy-tetrahydrodipicolinate synthase [Phycisphaeraceae bacterium]
MILQGAMTAMITPFRNGQVDFDRLAAHARWQIEQGIDGLVPVGTTGESPTLSHDEHRQVIEAVVNTARQTPGPGGKKVLVIAGSGSNSTSEALALTRHAHKVGADAALLVNPYYNRPTQEGLYRHFMTIADGVAIPQVLYNIPGRTAVMLNADTIARLAQHPNIIGVKEATGSIDMASEVISLTNPDKFSVVSGDDSLTLPLMAVGARGVISVVTNILAGRVKAMVDAAAGGNFTLARKLHYELFPLFSGCLKLATNPIPIKTAMQLLGRDTGELRLPLCELGTAELAKLKKLLTEMKVGA